MITGDRTDIDTLEAAFDAAERDARALVAGLPEELGGWRATPESWSVAQCLEHLATANRLYLSAMRPAAERAFRSGAGHGGLLDRQSLAAGLSARSSRRSNPRLEEKLEEHSAATVASASRGDRPFPESQDEVRVPADVFRNGSRRGALPEFVHPRPPVQPGNGAARHSGARATSPVAGLARS